MLQRRIILDLTGTLPAATLKSGSNHAESLVGMHGNCLNHMLASSWLRRGELTLNWRRIYEIDMVTYLSNAQVKLCKETLKGTSSIFFNYLLRISPRSLQTSVIPYTLQDPASYVFRIQGPTLCLLYRCWLCCRFDPIS